MEGALEEEAGAQFQERLQTSPRAGNPWDQTNLVQLSGDLEASDVIFFYTGLIKPTL